MRVSLNWVKRILDIEDFGISTDDLVGRLTLHLAEIDEVETAGVDLGDKVVVGKVQTCEQHPDADRLRVTTVDVGGDAVLPVVCGAPNVAAGQTVAVALVGAKLSMTDTKGELQTLTIKKGKLRGQPSHGMICAEDELGLGDSHDGIMVLDDALTVGTRVDQVVGNADTVLVVDNHNINHRPDLWGHLGWAREIAAILGFTAPAAPDLSWSPAADSPVSVRIDDERCRSYCGAVVKGVANGPSPAWMQELLTAAGVRPLGLLVDVTNYVMLELGEPMHAFDRRQLAGDAIIVRAATADEAFTTLDDKTLSLQPSDLVIADAERPVALAGIMGGANSGVADDTTEIVLEAAVFDAATIRRSRIRTGIATDSSNRFEKGLYPVGAVAAINRAIAILGEVHPDLTVTSTFGAGTTEADCRSISFAADHLKRFVGIDLPAADQWTILERIGVQRDGDTANTPWWRGKDLEAGIDLVEEVARLHGYQHIVRQVPRMPAAAPTVNRLRQAEHRTRRLLSAIGWDEVATYGFTSEAWCELLGWPEPIRLGHPLSSDMTVMRGSLLPNLAQAVTRNRRFLDRVQCYEVGKAYAGGAGTAPCEHERLQVAGIVAVADEDTPFYAARDAVLHLLQGLGYDPKLVALEGDVECQDGRAGNLMIDGTAYGKVAELPGPVRQLAGCPEATAWFCIELERLIADGPVPPPHGYHEPSRYQAVERDFTFVCPEVLTFGELAGVIAQSAGDLNRGIRLAQDIYRGEGIDDGHKAISLRVVLQADDRTLSEKELAKLNKRIVKSVEHRTPARLRA